MTRRLNVAMVAACPFPANRGTPSRILRMAEGLSRRGLDVAVVTYHLGQQVEVDNVDVVRTPKMPYSDFSPGPTFTKLLLLDPLLFLRLLQTVRTRKIDIIHAHHFEGALAAYAVRKITGVKVIYDAHTTLAGELSYYTFFDIPWVASFLDRKVPEWADHVIAVSATLKRFLLSEGIEASKVDVIPTGANSEVFSAGDPERIRRLHTLGHSSMVVYTGSLTAYQGVSYLIEAMKKVLVRCPDTMLLIVGEDRDSGIREMSRVSGLADRIIFAGEKPFVEIPDYLACADVAVSPRVECPGTPQKVTNYMAAGKAIVSFSGSAKILTHNENALVVANGDVQAMAEAIICLLEDRDLRQRLGEKAKEAFLESYSWPTLCSQVQSLYERLVP